ncbi:alanyl-tRNA editing protein [Lachnoclostridium sp. Marseille-P6806]|uniref:alanyl-tRNA editing protein n=1 Tax=Lachnoclostridium sp. Marseille-P6806 TaxID=2364793 RepID=UPI001030E70F|nr:alanine--tRNA ligase-related protein [Lachnoclostridium sp. Marseille-P6806]
MIEEFTEKFYRDPYARELVSKVLSCEPAGNGFAVVLDDTIFYPEGGGQPADHGTLRPDDGNGELRVTDVRRRKDGTIVHFCDAPVSAGTRVTGRIDWDRRFDLMQNHSGEHILSGLVHAALGYENVGFHMGEMITIDFSGPMDWETLMSLERQANGMVYRNLPIAQSYPDEAELRELSYRSKKELSGKVRIVTVPETDACACCGLHVARTGEIGLIKCFSLMNYKGGVRIEMASGRRALSELTRRVDQSIELSRMLAAEPGHIAEAVQRLRGESADKDRRLAEVMTWYFAAASEALPADRPLQILFEEGLSPVETRRFCDYLLERGLGAVALVLSRQEGGWYYCLGSRRVDVRAHAKALNANLSGRGGGSAEMIQGTWAAEPERIREVLGKEFSDVRL